MGQNQINNEKIDLFKHRFIFTDHPNYPRNDTIFLLHQKLTNKQYILTIKSNSDEKQTTALQQTICKKLATTNHHVTPIQQYLFEYKNNYCSKDSKCYIIFNIANTATLKHRLLQNKCTHQHFTEEQLLTNINAIGNALAWLRYQNHPHTNISPDTIYVKQHSFILADPWISPLNQPPGIYPSPEKLMAINDIVGKDDPYTSDIFSLGMVILECLFGVPQGVYKNNGRVDLGKIGEYIDKCQNTQLVNLLKVMLLGNPDDRKIILTGLLNRTKSHQMIKIVSKKQNQHNYTYLHANQHPTPSHHDLDPKDISHKDLHHNNRDGNANFTNRPTINYNTNTPPTYIRPSYAKQHPKQISNNYPPNNYGTREKSNSAYYSRPILQHNRQIQHTRTNNQSLIKQPPKQSKNYQPYKPYLQHKINIQPKKTFNLFDSKYLKKSELIQQTYQNKFNHKNITPIQLNNNLSTYNLNTTKNDQLFIQPYLNHQAKNNQLYHAKIKESLLRLQQKVKNTFITAKIQPLTNNATSSNNTPLPNQTTIIQPKQSSNIVNKSPQANKNNKPSVDDTPIYIHKQTNISQPNSKDNNNIILLNVQTNNHISVEQVNNSINQPIQADKKQIEIKSNPIPTNLQTHKRVQQEKTPVEDHHEQVAIYQNQKLTEQHQSSQLKITQSKQQQKISTPIKENQEIVINNVIPQDSQDQNDSLDEQIGQYVEQYYQNGGHYKGYVKNGKRSGQGTFFYKDGGYYQGHWKQNKMNGYGRLYYDTGRLAYEGYWSKDQFHGRGKVYNDNPTPLNQQFNFLNFQNIELYWEYYEGDLKHDSKQGYGKIMLSNGQSYEGQFKNDKVHGRGLFKTKSGKDIKGIWVECKFIKSI